jgi:hypothetical protein
MTTSITPMLGGFTFTQVSPSATWDIVHSLNTMAPVLDCWIDVAGSNEKIIPVSVTVIDAATVQITFSTAHAGIAYVI